MKAASHQESVWLHWQLCVGASRVGASGKEPTCPCRRPGFDPWVGKMPLEEDMANHSRILAWRMPWTEEPGRIQSTGSLRVGHD